MIYFLIKLIVVTLAIMITGYLLKGIEVKGFFPALIAALILGIVNAFIRPTVIFFTLPINIVTLGLFTFVVNGFMLWLTGAIVPGFKVKGCLPAIIGAIFISIISALLNYFIHPGSLFMAI